MDFQPIFKPKAKPNFTNISFHAVCLDWNAPASLATNV